MERARKDEGWCHQVPAQALGMDGGEETVMHVCGLVGISLFPPSLKACPALFLQTPPRRAQETLVLRSTFSKIWIWEEGPDRRQEGQLVACWNSNRLSSSSPLVASSLMRNEGLGIAVNG